MYYKVLQSGAFRAIINLLASRGKEVSYSTVRELPCCVKGVDFLTENNNNSSSHVQHTYTVEQIASILGVSVRKAYYLCDETDDFIVKRLGKRCLRINKISFDNWFNTSGDDS